jgi:hypothetical protein
MTLQAASRTMRLFYLGGDPQIAWGLQPAHPAGQSENDPEIAAIHACGNATF